MMREHRHEPFAPPGAFGTVVGVLVAVWCAAFAGVSVWLELTEHFAAGEYADFVAGFSVMNWFVTAIKLAGVVVALLAIQRHPGVLVSRIVGTLLWAAFATLSIYVVGSVVQGFLMLVGVAGDPGSIDGMAIAYVLLFLLAATGFGVLAISYARRTALGKPELLIGVVGAPIILGVILVVVPTLLAMIGLLPPL
jgi:hypothetical protein